MEDILWWIVGFFFIAMFIDIIVVSIMAWLYWFWNGRNK